MPVRTLLSALLLAPALLAPLAAQAAPHYRVTLLGTGWGDFGHGLSGNSISENGIAAGGYYDYADGRHYGYTWRDGVLSKFEGPSHSGVLVSGVNNSGTVVFSANDGPGTTYHAYTYAAGVVTALPELDSAAGSWGNAINNAGTVVGQGLATPPVFPGATLMGISHSGMVTGFGPGGAFLSDGVQTVPISPAGWSNITPFAINDAGAVVGMATLDGERYSRSFLFHNGGMTDLGWTHPLGTVALDVNNLGMAVGNSPEPDGTAYLYMNGQAHSLTSLIDPAYGLTITVANDINDLGQIAGQACGGPSNACTAVLLDPLSPVPEPGSWLMLGAGLGLLGVVARRRRG
jgi:probable HAF family extracellular repeat protein